MEMDSPEQQHWKQVQKRKLSRRLWWSDVNQLLWAGMMIAVIMACVYMMVREMISGE